MTAAADPHRLGHDHGQDGSSETAGRGKGGPASERIITSYGFWIFILSDIVMFSAFFAAYAVLAGATAGGPRPSDLFELRVAAIETACLLASSFACGLATIAVDSRHMLAAQAALLITGLLGFAFLVLEVNEFAGFILRGAGPTRSAFLSAYFTLVGCHGLHVGVGLLWLGTMMAQLWSKGFRDDVLRRTTCFALFWHALDIIWVALFTIVYLMGQGR